MTHKNKKVYEGLGISKFKFLILSNFKQWIRTRNTGSNSSNWSSFISGSCLPNPIGQVYSFCTSPALLFLLSCCRHMKLVHWRRCLQGSNSSPSRPWCWLFSSVADRIHNILEWIRMRIRGFMPLTNGSGSGSCYFLHWPSRCQQKTIFFLLNTFWRYIYIIYQRYKVKKSHKIEGIKVFLTIFAWW